MIQLIKNAAMTAVSFLSSNHVPPNTKAEDFKRLKSTNHMESKKFYIVLTSVAILAFFYFSSIGLLFFLPTNAPEFISGFVTIFSKNATADQIQELLNAMSMKIGFNKEQQEVFDKLLNYFSYLMAIK
jgi:hypothetical protein